MGNYADRWVIRKNIRAVKRKPGRKRPRPGDIHVHVHVYTQDEPEQVELKQTERGADHTERGAKQAE